MRIGIYGGTFDPPHAGHQAAAREAIEALDLDKLILIPAQIPPHKTLAENSATARQRLDMTRELADSLLQPGRVTVDEMELEREGKSYTAHTLRLLKERYPEDELWLIMGSDMFLTIQDWYQPQTIFSLCRLCAFSRAGGEDLEALRQQAERLRREFGVESRVLTLTRGAGVSSTQVRDALERGEMPEGLSEAVYGYILRHGLYGVRADLKNLSIDDLRSCSWSMVYAKRRAHILGVENTAVELALRWGADPDAARRAGILHDCTKYLSLQEHLDICERYGVELDDMERGSEKLLHSKTGAALARHLYGQNDAVYWAIYWHTTGRADMTLLEKIIYLADYMEPNRSFEGVDTLRQLCDTDLDAALLMGLQMSVDDLTARGVPIHKNTQGALDWMKEHRKG